MKELIQFMAVFSIILSLGALLLASMFNVISPITNNPVVNALEGYESGLNTTAGFITKSFTDNLIKISDLPNNSAAISGVDWAWYMSYIINIIVKIVFFIISVFALIFALIIGVLVICFVLLPVFFATINLGAFTLIYQIIEGGALLVIAYYAAEIILNIIRGVKSSGAK
jgi:hypothetical protein